MLLRVFEARLCLGIEIEAPEGGEKNQPKTQTIKAAH